jgi:protein phosphatase
VALAGDDHPSPRLFARARLEQRPEGPPTPRPLGVGSATTLGQRQHNEDDSFFGLVAGGYLALVTDGMGGHHTGDIAARLAAREIPAALAMILPFASIDEEPRCLVTAVAVAHEAIGRLQEDPSHAGIGTTVAAVLFCEDRAHLVHVGNSRADRLRQGQLEALTRDHSLRNDYLDFKPDLSAEQLAALPRNIITRALGIMPNPLLPTRTTVLIEPRDVFLVCTDGLHETLTPEQMASLLAAHAGDAARAAQALADAAQEAGGEDNITVVVVDTALDARQAGARS